MAATYDPERLEHCLEHAGLRLSSGEKQELAMTYVAIAQMVERLRTPRDEFAELGHCFAVETEQ